NVPYDSALVLCKDAEAHRAAMTVSASYLIQDDARLVRDQVDWVPEFSRRARGFAVYAALRSLGRSGLAELVERTCDCARQFADEIITLPGVELLNNVVLNQVLFRFDTDEQTDDVLRAVQDAGRIWLSGTTWDGRAPMCDERSHLPRRRDPDRVLEHDLGRGGEALGQVRDHARVDLPLIGAAECHADRDRDRQLRALDDLGRGGTGFRTRLVRV